MFGFCFIAPGALVTDDSFSLCNYLPYPPHHPTTDNRVRGFWWGIRQVGATGLVVFLKGSDLPTALLPLQRGPWSACGEKWKGKRNGSFCAGGNAWLLGSSFERRKRVWKANLVCMYSLENRPLKMEKGTSQGKESCKSPSGEHWEGK